MWLVVAQAIAFFLPAVFGAAGSTALVTAAGALTVAGMVTNVVIGVALTSLSRPKIPEAVKPENIRINKKEAASDRVGHYGTVKVGGAVVFHRAKEGVSYRVFVHGHCFVDQVLGYYLNHEPVSLDSDGYVTDSQYVLDRPMVRIRNRMGKVPETHYALLSSALPEWTEHHRLDGLFSTLAICESVKPEKYQKMYPRGEPELAVVARTSQCFDPRTDQTEFTENAALIIADYISSPNGLGRSGAVDWENISKQADIADRVVGLLSSETEALYRLSGSYLFSERPQDVLGRMLEACAGRVMLQPNGKVKLELGYWEDPTVTISFDDVLEIREASPGPDLLDRYNELPARFVSRELGFVEVDAEPWIDQERQDADGQVLTSEVRNLQMCPSHRQARQVMKIHMERDNPQQSISLVVRPAMLPAIYETRVRFVAQELGIDGIFEVSGHSILFENGTLRGISLTLNRTNEAAFQLGINEHGAIQNLPDPPSSAGVPVPQDVTASGQGVQVAGNSFAAGIGVGWDAPISDALSPVVKYRLSGQGDWNDVVVGSNLTSITIPGLTDGVLYDVSVAFMSPGGVIGVEAVVEAVKATAVNGPPLPPTELRVTDMGAGQAEVSFVSSASPSLWKSEVYRDGALVGVVQNPPGTPVSFIDQSGAGTFSWSVRSVNVSAIPSEADAGPIEGMLTD